MSSKPKAPDNSAAIRQQEEQLALMREQMKLQEEANSITKANLEKQRQESEAEAQRLKDQNAATLKAKQTRGMGRSLLSFGGEDGVLGGGNAGFTNLLKKTLG